MPPLNLDKKYGDNLEYAHMSIPNALISLRRIFDRDIINDPCKEFNGKKIVYVRDDSNADKVFKHLVMNSENGQREYIEGKRAERLHWIKPLLEKAHESAKYWIFSHEHPKHGLKTYIYHRKMKHVIILEPNLITGEYFFITAFKVYGTGINDIVEKHSERLENLI